MEYLIIVYILKDKKNKNVYNVKTDKDLFYFFKNIAPCCLSYDLYMKSTVIEEFLFD